MIAVEQKIEVFLCRRLQKCFSQCRVERTNVVLSSVCNCALMYPIILQARAAGTAVEGQSREEETEEDHPRV